MPKKENPGKPGFLRQYTGKYGERIAKEFLLSRRFSILEQNFLTPFGEIDIVAEKGGCVVFVEVRTRIGESFGTPLESITKTKKEHIIKNCRYYLKRRGLSYCRCRIDVISVKLDASGGLKILKHIENAINEE